MGTKVNVSVVSLPTGVLRPKSRLFGKKSGGSGRKKSIEPTRLFLAQTKTSDPKPEKVLTSPSIAMKSLLRY